MRIMFADIESFFDRKFSLKKLTPPEYILDPRYETICMGVAFNTAPVDFIDGPDVQAFLATVNPQETIVICYNSLFDCSILAWRYNFVPYQMVDALGLARTLLGYRLRSLSLEAVAEYLGMGKKGDTLDSVVGMHRADIMAQPELWEQFRQYCMNDVELLRKIFFELRLQFPATEYPVLDLVLRAAVQPRFHVDVPLLIGYLAELRAIKEQLLLKADTDRDTILGNKSFKQLLEDRGVEIKTKDGKNGKQIPAIAKTDDFMAELQEHADPVVQALVAARLGHKSTLAETRVERFINIAQTFSAYHHDHIPYMPVPLRYAGARTHRFSGDWRLNLQNLPRGSPLRKALQAPPGYQVIVGDLSQIEARLVAWLAGATELLGTFARGEDPYKAMAVHIFGVKLEGVTAFQRLIAKFSVLGLGYGMGKDKFYNMVVGAARAQGTDMSLLKDWTEDLAEQAVKTYRRVNYAVEDFWFELNRHLDERWRQRQEGVAVVGPMEIGRREDPQDKDRHYGYIRGPTELEMRYDYPWISQGKLQYSWGGVPSQIYGCSVLENICQHLAGVIIKGAMVRMGTGKHLMAHQCHDELVLLAPDEDVDKIAELLLTELTRQPGEWAEGLPLAAEVKVGPTYGDLRASAVSAAASRVENNPRPPAPFASPRGDQIGL